MKYNDFKIGFKGSFTRVVTYEENVKFGEISGDLNPLHFEDVIATKLGFHGAVSNGFVAESRIAAALVETFGSSSTIVVALEKNTKFLKPVYMGDIIRAVDGVPLQGMSLDQVPETTAPKPQTLNPTP